MLCGGYLRESNPLSTRVFRPVRMVVVRGTSSLGMDRRTSPPERSNSTERARSKVIGATEPDPGLNF